MIGLNYKTVNHSLRKIGGQNVLGGTLIGAQNSCAEMSHRLCDIVFDCKATVVLIVFYTQEWV